MQTPTIPTIPTDSLHRFLSITGLILIFFPPLYLDKKISEIEVSIIRTKTERKIIDTRTQAINNEFRVLTTRIYGKEIDFLSPIERAEILDSLGKRRKLYSISVDSANSELKKLYNIATEQKILAIQVDEKDEIITHDTVDTRRYFHWSIFSLITGFGMATLGFLLWFIKEYTDYKFTIIPFKKKRK